MEPVQQKIPAYYLQEVLNNVNELMRGLSALLHCLVQLELIH